MYGHLVPRQDMEGRKAVLERGALCGMSVLRALVPLPAGLGERRAERRIYRAALRLWDAGVARVLTPEGFSQWPALRRAGLGPVETQELCRSAAAPLALAALTVRGWEPGRAVVALAGARVSAPLFQAAETLARQVCRLVVEAPVGGAALSEYLHEEFGLPVLPPGTVRPALTVAFDDAWQGRGPALRLWGERPDLLGAELWSPGLELPEGCEALPLLAALRESGMLPPGALLARPAGKPP